MTRSESGSTRHTDDANAQAGLQGFMLSERVVTTFCFDLRGRIVIPDENRNLAQNRIMNVRLNFVEEERIIVVPNSSNALITFSLAGVELWRTYLPVDVVDLAIGVRGFPLLIGNNTNLVLECIDGNARQIIRTHEMIPHALASLNNGRVVVCGRNQGSHPWKVLGLIHIYEYNGDFVREIPTNGNGYQLEKLQCVDVNLSNNDIYIGDQGTGSVLLFKENGKFVSSYVILKIYAALDVGLPGFPNRIAPMAIVYDGSNSVIFASCIECIGNCIHVLSPGLDLLGFVSSKQSIGFPGGLSIDDKGRLYVGDAVDGIIRVFDMSEFKNNLRRTK